MTERELRLLGDFIFQGLKFGSIAIQNATDQAAIKQKSYATVEDIVGIVLHGRFPHAFQVAVVEAWLGPSRSASVTIDRYRDLFVEELLRLVPHEHDSILTTRPTRRALERALASGSPAISRR